MRSAALTYNSDDVAQYKSDANFGKQILSLCTYQRADLPEAKSALLTIIFASEAGSATCFDVVQNSIRAIFGTWGNSSTFLSLHLMCSNQNNPPTREGEREWSHGRFIKAYCDRLLIGIMQNFTQRALLNTRVARCSLLQLRRSDSHNL